MLRPSDIPAEASEVHPGRAVPADRFDRLVAALPLLEANSFGEVRLTVQLLMDTGSRPGEICELLLDCLDRDADGKYLLIYNDDKANRRGRRLPIQVCTGAVILAQQLAVREPAGLGHQSLVVDRR